MEKKRTQSLGEEIGNSITHGLGCIFSIVALILMYIKANETNEYIGVTFFGVGMFLLYIMSCLYHAFKNDSKVKRIFRRFDHLSIYILIGGTFAPILLCAISQPLGYIYFAIQWSVIVIGIILKAVSTNKLPIIHLICYLLLGWSGIALFPELWETKWLFSLVLCGGIAYSAGIYFYKSKFKFSHFIWHFFCLIGTILHFIAIYGFIL